MVIIIISTTTIKPLSNHVAYAHTFSENENALFITIVHQVQIQIQLVENNFPTNAKLAQQHLNLAIGLLNQNDPIVNNTTWSKEIGERNQRVASELTSALNSLKTVTITTQSKPTLTTSTAAANPANDIKAKVSRISDLLGEAVSSRVSKESLNNSTTQALVLANLANEIYFSYGRALGESAVAMSNMAGMAMAGNGASMNMNMNSTGNSGMTSNMATMTSSNTIKNVTDYQTAQSLAAKAQEVFNKNLKPIATSPKLTAANTGVEKDVNQLKAAIDNKASFNDIMKLVHIQLHPTLITAYNLQLKTF